MPRETSKNETSMRLLYVGFEEVVRYTVLRFINELILVVNVSEILCSTTEGIQLIPVARWSTRNFNS